MERTSIVKETKVLPQERGGAIITGRLWGQCCKNTVEEYTLQRMCDNDKYVVNNIWLLLLCLFCKI